MRIWIKSSVTIHAILHDYIGNILRYNAISGQLFEKLFNGQECLICQLFDLMN